MTENDKGRKRERERNRQKRDVCARFKREGERERESLCIRKEHRKLENM